MVHIKITILFWLITFGFTTAQVDTTDWFPMQTGNYWEYMALTGEGPKYFYTTVTGDTLMPNGNLYKIFYNKYFDNTSEFTLYYRKDADSVCVYTGISSFFPLGEYKFLDFLTPDSTIWLIIPIYICCNPNARGIATTFFDHTYFNFLQKPNEAKLFEDVYIDSTDTLWTPNDASFPIELNRGLGIVWYFIFNDGSYYLQGAIINGQQMGNFVSVKDETPDQPTDFKLYQNYPNPFNPTTEINYNLAKSGNITLKVYNILGSEVASLVDGFMEAGKHNVKFDANDFTSGIYFYTIKADNFTSTRKMILIK